jgi:Holliday junction DNA helicase RuvA
MIASISGTLHAVRDHSVVVLVGGLGFEVYVPSNVFNAYTDIGQPVDLATCMVVRDDSLTLYGFLLEEERQAFELLLGVPGVGPRLSLAVLSTLSLDMLGGAVQRDEPEVIARVPGVGKKTAQKIALELKGKLLPEGIPAELAAISSTDTEVIAALTALGYSIVEAQAALQSIPRDAPDEVEERIRLALAYFAE